MDKQVKSLFEHLAFSMPAWCFFKPRVAVLRDYERQLKKGIDPVFIPENYGIENAELWHDIVNENYSEELKAYQAAFPEK